MSQGVRSLFCRTTVLVLTVLSAASRSTQAPGTASGARGAATSAPRATRRSIRSTPATSARSRWRGGSRPTTSAPRPDFNLQTDAADGQRRALLHRRRASQRRRAERRDRRDAVDASARGRPARRSCRRAGCRAAASATGPTARATSASSTSRSAISSSASTRRPGSPLQRLRHQRRHRSEEGRRPGARPRSTADIAWNGAPVVAKNVVIVGAAHRAGSAPRSKENAKGYIRGYDARTGKRLWIFHTIPQPGEFGNDTWLEDSWAYTGNTGVWTQITVDEELGIAYLPVEIPTGDYFGGHRPGNNLFAESLVAVDLETGKRIWHFQFVHHPIWDYDMPCAPILVDITVDGRPIKAVAQPTKQGFVFVFDRADRRAGVADRGAPRREGHGADASGTRRRSPSRPSRRRSSARASSRTTSSTSRPS